jgi:hypothetical protein
MKNYSIFLKNDFQHLNGRGISYLYYICEGNGIGCGSTIVWYSGDGKGNGYGDNGIDGNGSGYGYGQLYYPKPISHYTI